MPPKLQYSCCSDKLDDSVDVFCNGPAHKGPRKYHSECADAEDRRSQSQQSQLSEQEWFCLDCQAMIMEQEDTDSSETQTQAFKADDSQQQEVDSILGLDLANYEGRQILHFEFKWADGDITPVPFFHSNAQKLEFAYFETWTQYPQDLQIGQEDKATVNPALQYLGESYGMMLKTIAPAAVSHKVLANLYSEESFAQARYEILISVPVAVLQCLISGTSLRMRKTTDANMYAWLANNRRKSQKPSRRPCIYTVEFTDMLGHTPTFADMHQIIEGIRTYADPRAMDVDGEDFAIRVDSVGTRLAPEEKQEVRDGKRKWLINDDARERLDVTLEKLEERMLACLTADPDEQRRMPFPMRDIGYTHDSKQRLDDQQNLSLGSNKNMSLFHAVSKALKLGYAMYAEVIFLCFREEHAMLAEIAFSVLAQSYIETGKGFNTIEAGRSIASNKMYDISHWNAWQTDIHANSPSLLNHEQEKARVKKLELEVQGLKVEELKQHVEVLTSIEETVDTIRRL